MEDLLIFPFGGNAREGLISILAINKMSPTWNVLGFLDDNEDMWGKDYCGVKIVGGRRVITDNPLSKILAVPGNPNNYLERDKIISTLNIKDEKFVSIIDPSATVAPNASIGKNTLIMANVVISSSVKIGNHCVILPNSVISHDSRVEDYSLIGSNVSISGSCVIGRNCFIGSGSSIKDHITVYPRSLIGIGSCVVKDVTENTVVAGNPARPIR
jgi:sugar O-acyltransferase (sialic acid O-acetyltransferase NeuD family)